MRSVKQTLLNSWPWKENESEVPNITVREWNISAWNRIVTQKHYHSKA